MMRKVIMTLGLAAAAMTTLTSCDFDFNDAANTVVGVLGNPAKCTEYEQQFQDEIAQEGKLVNTINTTGDYSMALVLNASSINKLFRAATEWNYTLDLTIASIDLQLPTIEVGGCRDADEGYAYTLDYDNCLSFTLPLSASFMGSEFKASAKFGFPIETVIDSTQSKTSVYIDMKKAQILGLSAQGYAAYDTLLQLLETGLKALISDKLPTAHLFDIAAWEIGDNNIKLLAGSPRVNETEGTLTLGMYSNIFFSKTETVQWDEAFPKDAEIGIHIHPDLIRGVLSRMMYEGHIDDSISLTDSSSSSGTTNSGFKVSMANIAEEYPQDTLLQYDANWKDYFTFAFRLWSTESFCGYMDLLAGLNIELSDNKFQIGLGNLHAGKSEGAMSLSAAAFNTIASTEFFQQALNFTNISFNFDQLTVSDSKGADNTMRQATMGADHFQFNVEGNGISLYLNFLDL